MRKVLITLLAGGAAVAMATSAMAQGYDTAQREDSIRARIADGVDRGDLSYRQADTLRHELNQIVNLDARYQDDGMSSWEARDLHSRLSLLDSRLNYDLNATGGDEDVGY